MILNIIIDGQEFTLDTDADVDGIDGTLTNSMLAHMAGLNTAQLAEIARSMDVPVAMFEELIAVWKASRQ